MANKYAWSRHSDDEIWYGGPCDSIKECVEEAIAEGYELSDTFAIGLIENYKINTNLADIIIERLQEDAYDEVGEVSDGWLDSATPDDIARLDCRLSQLVSDWLKEVKEEPNFYTIAPCNECTLEEALAEHHERMKTTPKGGIRKVF